MGLNVIVIVIKMLFKFIKFTGFYFLILGYMALDYEEYKFNRGELPTFISHETGQLLVFIIIVICMLLSIITLLQNIIRLAKPDFSFLSLILNHRKVKKKEVGETFEKIDNSFRGLESGIVFGKMKNEYLVMAEHTEGHIMVVGGQGSGKSTTVAIPTLLNYNSSAFVIDIKGELAEVSRNFRADMKIFDPLNEDSPHYDPYLVLKEGDKVQGAREIVNSIIPIGADEKDPYWKQSAQNLLTSCILHFENEGKDFPTTCQYIMKTPVNELVERLTQSPVEEVKLFINQFIGIDMKQLASIYSTLSNEIILFATDKDIIRSLKRNSDMISPYDLENYTDIFIKINEEKLEQWKGLLNLIVSQFLKSFEKRQNNQERKILFMIDEFARIGKVKNITNVLATLRSKGIQIMLIVQSLAQLDGIYGKDTRKVITDNCNYKIVLNANDVDTQEYFSKLVGTVDIEKKSNSINNSNFNLSSNRGVSTSSEEKRIIKPEAFAYLQKPVVFTPKGFFRPDKVKWYEDKIFIERAEV